MSAATGPSPARAIVDHYELSLSQAERRRLGAHYTPEPLARRLVRLAADAFTGVPRTVCDPCCGAGAVLLAAADHLVARGVEPAEVVASRLLGVDIDPAAVDAARRALVGWAAQHGVRRPPVPRVVVADGLMPVRTWGAGAGPIDLVVGNPPFLTQLAADTARTAAERRELANRFGDLGSYTDAAAVHLLAALDAVAPGGVVCLLQPQSVLGARDAGAVRAAVTRRGRLVALWATDERPFDAQVMVCAPVLQRRAVDHRSTDPVRVMWNDAAPVEVAVPVPGPSPGGGMNWSPLLAGALGVPPVADPPAGIPTVAEVATVTAGFRDEFYALTAAAEDRADGDAPRLVTVGMIDPGRLAWGTGPYRLAGRRMVAPRVDMAALRSAQPRVGRWAEARLRPKVLVASQTRVLEVVVDDVGDCVPVTPVVSVETHDPGVSPAMVAAALAAPCASARLGAVAAGTGLGSGVLRVAAGAVGRLPLPCDPVAWAGATLAWCGFNAPETTQTDRDRWAELGRRLDAAHGIHAPELVDWWLDRLPALRRRPLGKGSR